MDNELQTQIAIGILATKLNQINKKREEIPQIQGLN